MSKKQQVKKRNKNKRKVNSKKKVVDGIHFASTLESQMYQLLKQSGIYSVYEGKSYITFNSFDYGEECYERVQRRSKEMVDRKKVLQVSYTPDFIGQNEEWIIEVKGRANESFPIRWKLFKNLMMKRENPPILFKPTNLKDCLQVIEILKSKGYGKN